MKKVKLDFTKYTDIKGPYKGVTSQEANKWNSKSRKLPIELLTTSYKEVSLDSNAEHLVHWFRNDLRIQDNTSLYHMVRDAKRVNAHPIGLYVISTKFWHDHCEGAFKIDFIMRSVEQLRHSLEEFGIPLSVVYLDDSKENINFAEWFHKLITTRFRSNDVYFNIQYEYDEMKRDISLLKTSLRCHIFHDQCIVPPMTLTTGTGSQYSKFTPWYKKWNLFLEQNPIKLHVVSHKFEQWDHEFIKDDAFSLDTAFTLESLDQFGVHPAGNVKPAGEERALEQLHDWLNNIKRYHAQKDFPALHSTSELSAYISIGSISSRTILEQCTAMNHGKRTGGDTGISTFVKEVAWRDFYRHILVKWPYLMLYTPFNFTSLDIRWNEDISRFEKWCLGRTGFPLIDAAMRQLLQTGYMNNRLRMVCASFLAKDLLQDWRMGEKWFHHHLIDADLSSNNGGWGWCSSTGVDAQPWFRIFNVYTQSEKFDPEGDYIKQWVPELRHLNRKEIHSPPPQDNYPEPIVNRKDAREVALERYREALT